MSVDTINKQEYSDTKQHSLVIAKIADHYYASNMGDIAAILIAVIHMIIANPAIKRHKLPLNKLHTHDKLNFIGE